MIQVAFLKSLSLCIRRIQSCCPVLILSAGIFVMVTGPYCLVRILGHVCFQLIQFIPVVWQLGLTALCD